MKLFVKGTMEQALAAARRRGVNVKVIRTNYDEETEAHETELRVDPLTRGSAQRWIKEDMTRNYRQLLQRGEESDELLDRAILAAFPIGCVVGVGR